MSSIFSIGPLVNSENIDAISLLRLCERKIVIRITEIRTRNPNYRENKKQRN